MRPEGLVRRRWASRAAVQDLPTSKQCEFGSREQSTEYVSPRFWPFLNVIYTVDTQAQMLGRQHTSLHANLTRANEGVSLRGNHFPLAFSEFRFV